MYQQVNNVDRQIVYSHFHDNNNCDMFKYENLRRVHESVGNPDSKRANLSWMPYKDLKILTKKKKKNYIEMLVWCNGGTNYLYHTIYEREICVT